VREDGCKSAGKVGPGSRNPASGRGSAALSGRYAIERQLAGGDENQRHDLVVVENFFRELREKVGR